MTKFRILISVFILFGVVCNIAYADLILPYEFSYLPFEVRHGFQKHKERESVGSIDFDEEGYLLPFGANYFPMDRGPYYPFWKDAIYYRNENNKLVKKELKSKQISESLAYERSLKAYYTIMPYYASITYGQDDERKESAVAIGSLFSRSDHDSTFYFDYSMISMLLDDEETITQTGIVVSYAQVLAEGFLAGLGLNKMFSSTSNGSEIIPTNMYFLNLKYFDALGWEIGSNLYYTKYASSNIPNFSVLQLSPFVGLTTYFAEKQFFHFKFCLNSINVNRRQFGVIDQKQYTSFMLSGSYTFHTTTFYLSRWIGDQKYAATKGGFVLNNSDTLYTDGLEIYISHMFDEGIFFKLSYSMAVYKINDDGDESSSNSVVGSLGITF